MHSSIRAILKDDKNVLKYEAVSSGTEHILPAVVLEFGARLTDEPVNRYKITCDISDSVKDLRVPIAHARVMRAERTFREKATTIHTYCLRGSFRGGYRYAQHWYDLDCLDHTNITTNAIRNRTLAEDVAVHRKHFFAEKDKTDNVIDYQAAVSGGCVSYLRGQLVTHWLTTISKCSTLVCFTQTPLVLKS